jgi:hypothetical protein
MQSVDQLFTNTTNRLPLSNPQPLPFPTPASHFTPISTVVQPELELLRAADRLLSMRLACAE